jgi:hypothetical protein
MHYKDPDPDDPHLLVAVMLPADEQTVRKMACVFAEEFAFMGYNKSEILNIFQNPYYTGAHGAYRALGEEVIRAIIDECTNVRGQVKFSILNFGFSMEGRGRESKIGNPKSKMAEGRGEDG